MLSFGKLVLGAALAGGVALAASTAPADAQVTVGIGVGPGFYGGNWCYWHPYSWRCSGPYWRAGWYGGPYWGWRGGWYGRPGWGWRGGWYGRRWRGGWGWRGGWRRGWR